MSGREEVVECEIGWKTEVKFGIIFNIGVPVNSHKKSFIPVAQLTVMSDLPPKNFTFYVQRYK
jgi:hypothetical protein